MIVWREVKAGSVVRDNKSHSAPSVRLNTPGCPESDTPAWVFMVKATVLFASLEKAVATFLVIWQLYKCWPYTFSQVQTSGQNPISKLT